MEYIKKITDFSDKKKIKKYLWECVWYKHLPFSSRIIRYGNFLIMLIAFHIILGIECYMEKESGMLRIPIYFTAYFGVIVCMIFFLLIIWLVIYLEYWWMKKNYPKTGKFRLFIFKNGIEYCLSDSEVAPVEAAFKDMKDLKVCKNGILYSILLDNGKQRYQYVNVPAFDLSLSERSKIRQWYRQQTKSVAPKKKNRKLMFAGILFIILIFGSTIYIFNRMEAEIVSYKSAKTEAEADFIPREEIISEEETANKNIPEKINEELEKVQQSGYTIDEGKLLEEINKRGVYREQCSFWGEVLSYMENVREIRDIANLTEHIYRTNEIYYTKENFAYDPPLIIYLAINEIYARHGYQFKNADLDNYFRGMVWYEPLYTAEEFDTSVFNDCEQHNLQILRELDTYERN